MTIQEEYLHYQEKYAKKYGKDRTILLMQVGSFHEAYATLDRGFDLQKLSDLLDIVLTRKDKSNTTVNIKNPLMCPVVDTTVACVVHDQGSGKQPLLNGKIHIRIPVAGRSILLGEGIQVNFIGSGKSKHRVQKPRRNDASCHYYRACVNRQECKPRNRIECNN